MLHRAARSISLKLRSNPITLLLWNLPLLPSAHWIIYCFLTQTPIKNYLQLPNSKKEKKNSSLPNTHFSLMCPCCLIHTLYSNQIILTAILQTVPMYLCPLTSVLLTAPSSICFHQLKSYAFFQFLPKPLFLFLSSMLASINYNSLIVINQHFEAGLCICMGGCRDQEHPLWPLPPQQCLACTVWTHDRCLISVYGIRLTPSGWTVRIRWI